MTYSYIHLYTSDRNREVEVLVQLSRALSKGLAARAGSLSLSQKHGGNRQAQVSFKVCCVTPTASPLTVVDGLLLSSVQVSGLVWDTPLAVSGDDGFKGRLQAGMLIHALSTSPGHGLPQHWGGDPREIQLCPPRARGLTGVGVEEEAGRDRATEELRATGTPTGEGLLAPFGPHLEKSSQEM